MSGDGVPVVAAGDVCGCVLSERGDRVWVVEELLEPCREVVHVALAERHAVHDAVFAPEHVGAFGDVAGQAAVPVAQRLEQAHRHALQIAGQHVRVRVGIQFRQLRALREPGKHDARIRSSCLPDRLVVFGGIRCAASDHEPLAGVQALERVNEVMHALLRNDAPQEQHVGVLHQPPLLRDQVRSHRLHRLDAVRDQTRGPAVRPLEVLLNAAAQHYHLVRAPGRRPLAELQVHGGEFAPLGTLPVKTVNGRYRANARPMRQTQHDAGAFGMIVDHVRFSLDSL